MIKEWVKSGMSQAVLVLRVSASFQNMGSVSADANSFNHHNSELDPLNG